MEEFRLAPLSPASEWYQETRTNKELVDRLKKWCGILDPERVEDKNSVEYINAKRKLALCKILILRAHGILPTELTDYGIINPFLKRDISRFGC